MILIPFQLKVSGNNLINVCKLVFKVSRDEKNDAYFMEDNILGMSLQKKKYVLIITASGRAVLILLCDKPFSHPYNMYKPVWFHWEV